MAVQVSPRFYGWVAGFAGAVEITAPADVRAEMKRVLDTPAGAVPVTARPGFPGGAARAPPAGTN